MKLPIILSPLKALSQLYAKALRRFLKQPLINSAATHSALKLGRKAVAMRLETLDLALIHEKALLDQIIPINDSAAREKILKHAGVFFAEAFIPMEEGHRSAIESNARLSLMNKALNMRTQELIKSNRQLKKEIERREVVEKKLRASELNSGALLKKSGNLQVELRHLSQQILSVQEEERKRISRELHDVVAQLLTGINVRLATLKLAAVVNTAGLRRKITHTQKLVEKSVNIVHKFARELRPAVLDDLGLIPALKIFLKTYTQETGIRVSLTTFVGLEELSNSKRTVFYRVVQEALTNVVRHAKAHQVKIVIQKILGVVRMKIVDDGCSFDVLNIAKSKKNKRLGLLGMRERVEMVGGTFLIASAQGQGTTITVKIPLKKSSRSV